MLRRRRQPLRNKLDLADAKQVRLLKKRLRLSEADLIKIVGKIGNSIAAISKEAAVQRARQLPEPKQIPAVAVAASATADEVTATETSVSAELNA